MIRCYAEFIFIFQDWELCFLDDVTDDNNERALTILLQLWCSRDVLVRAAVLQLFAGLCVNPKIAVEIARGKNVR